MLLKAQVTEYAVAGNIFDTVYVYMFTGLRLLGSGQII
jgi:hypothetical protein